MATRGAIFISVCCGLLWAIVLGAITHFLKPELVTFNMFVVFLSFSAMTFVWLTIGSTSD